MKWIQERDALIAQTMAFVQSVTGKRDDVAAVAAPSPAPEPAKIAVEEPVTASEPVPVATLPTVRLVSQARPDSDVRAEIQARIANFRKHQERFERERQEYFSATLGRLRDANRDRSPPELPET